MVFGLYLSVTYVSSTVLRDIIRILNGESRRTVDVKSIRIENQNVQENGISTERQNYRFWTIVVNNYLSFVISEGLAF